MKEKSIQAKKLKKGDRCHIPHKDCTMWETIVKVSMDNVHVYVLDNYDQILRIWHKTDYVIIQVEEE